MTLLCCGVELVVDECFGLKVEPIKYWWQLPINSRSDP